MKKKSSHHPSHRHKPELSRWHAAPLKGSFMVLSIIGFLISAYLMYPQSNSFGWVFMFIFALMFIASLISMTKAPVIEV